MKEML